MFQDRFPITLAINKTRLLFLQADSFSEYFFMDAFLRQTKKNRLIQSIFFSVFTHSLSFCELNLNPPTEAVLTQQSGLLLVVCSLERLMVNMRKVKTCKVRNKDVCNHFAFKIQGWLRALYKVCNSYFSAKKLNCGPCVHGWTLC